jgi:phosphoribosyl-ATP pyrophosphohydrolase
VNSECLRDRQGTSVIWTAECSKKRWAPPPSSSSALKAFHVNDIVIMRLVAVGVLRIVRNSGFLFFQSALRCCPSGSRLAGKQPSWTAKLLANPELLCSKVREEARELAQTLEAKEGRRRTASEAADLIYHALVLLNHEGVAVSEVMRELRRRFGVSGVAEKASR